MTTIVTEFGELRYNCLPMGMYALGDIFQYIVYKMNHDIKVLKRYIDNILFLNKERFSNNISQLRIIFGRLRDSVLKVNALN